jgi:hypothetical protein
MDNVYQRISKVMQEVQYLGKDDMVVTNAYSGAGYKAISEEKVTTEIRKSLIKNGLVIVPIEMEHTRDDEVLKDKTGNEKVSRLATVNVKYRIQNIDDKDDFIIATSSGTGVDTQDKAVGKAMTYAYKYLLLRTFAIPTGEDTDKISSEMYDGQFQEKKAKITKGIADELRDRIKTQGKDYMKVRDILDGYGFESLDDITTDKYGEVSKKIDKIK